ncbi:helix-turn-helix domain-containing protein [Fodinibius salsisoli]|uniref:Helix-turn-helix domain-containing protein n=1 Tax=Fodinibius salsisoli TaxID=2820877 RepID=A0ABT3PSP7_9BACT|nr:helix-turn-helix domain-containing protein [Fodinibius salsisoli]MCW9708855.1 helix-turn-helix domain-containing protein [Fodinibius salsisoli]
MPSLGNDLALIRKSQGLTIEEIHQSTKIPKKVLSSIEDNSIFQNSDGSAIYVRSYVRSYAKALSIEEQKIVYALNRVQHNNYDGSLIEDEQRSSFEDSDAPDQKNDDITEQTKDDEASQEEEETTSDQPSQPEASAPKEENPVLRSQDVESVDWVNLGYQFQPAKTVKSKRRFALIVGLILLAVAAFFVYWFYFKGAPTNTQTTQQGLPQTTSTPDSIQSELNPRASDDTVNLSDFRGQPQAQGALPDTLSIVLYAAYEKLEPVRVYTDITDQLNPYWIQRGEAIEFDFVNEFHFRDGLSSIVLLMNGHVITDFEEQFLNPETGRVEINRSFFQEDSKWLQPAPDTLPIQAPPPSVVHDLDN